MRVFVVGALVLPMVAMAAGQAHAQSGPARVEIGGQISGLGLQTSPDGTGPTPGVGVQLTIGLMRRLAIETRLTLFPRNELTLSQSQGGRSMQFSVGVRGTFLQRQRLSIYGVMLPGVLRFSNTLTALTATPIAGSVPLVVAINEVIGPSTHFTLGIGGGLEFSPSARTVARVQVTSDLFVSPAVGVALPANTNGSFLTFSYPAKIVGTAQISANLTYRLGTVKRARATPHMTGRWVFGAQLGSVVSSDVLGQAISRNAGIGGFMSYRVTDHIDIDGAIGTELGSRISPTPFQGGRAIRALGGVKVGTREGRLAMFGKTRLGMTSYSQTFQSMSGPSAAAKLGRANVMAIEVGGVVELSLTPRVMLRFDAGDTISIFHDVAVTIGSMRFVERPSPSRTDSMHLTTGFGVRF